ncbi:MAG: hypothetical protein CME24_16965 [Gemmatimonadetes bacterium]|nr:hypothetical protein [Gemmatimonadota bacterium]
MLVGRNWAHDFASGAGIRIAGEGQSGNTSSRRRVPTDRESTREVGILVIRASFFRMINQTGS